MEYQVRYLALFLLFSVIDSFKWFWMVSLHKNILLMQELFKAPLLDLHFFLICINDPPDVICDIAICVDDTTLYSKCEQVSRL